MKSFTIVQGYDLNDPNTPHYIFERFNDAYEAAGSPRGPLPPGTTARERGAGVAFGFPNSVTGQSIDYNMSRPASSTSDNVIVPFEARAPILGFNIPEAVLLQSSGNSIYHALQVNVTQRTSKDLQFNTSYT